MDLQVYDGRRQSESMRNSMIKYPAINNEAIGSRALAENSTNSGGEILHINRGSVCGSEHNAATFVGGALQNLNGKLDVSQA